MDKNRIRELRKQNGEVQPRTLVAIPVEDLMQLLDDAEKLPYARDAALDAYRWMRRRTLREEEIVR